MADEPATKPIPPVPGPFIGWRKKPGGVWEKIEKSQSDKKGQCYQLLMDLCCLQQGDPEGTDYRILPLGQYPSDERTYRTREMRPQR